MTKIQKLKTIFLGTPRFAKIILELLTESPFWPALVITEPDKPVGRAQTFTPPPVKVLAGKLGIPVAQPATHAELFDVVQKFQPDLGIVAAYGRILKPELLTVPRHGFVNVHASLLPKYRGASPIQAAILAGETETGVTIMQIDEGLDTGAILSWAPVAIDPMDTTPTLSDKLAEVGGSLLVATLPDLLDGTLEPRPQNNAEATVTRLLTKEDGRLLGTESPELILRMLRAYTPWPGVWVELDGQRVILLDSHLKGGNFIPERVQLAGKTPVDWSTFQRDRPALANRLIGLINKKLSNTP